MKESKEVLILVLVEEPIGAGTSPHHVANQPVLILVLVEEPIGGKVTSSNRLLGR